MKKLSAISVGLLSVAVSGAALAVNGGPKKDILFHCGCTADGEALEWAMLNVSKNARGHRNHVPGQEEECYDESGSYVGTYTRGWADCEAEGGADITDVEDCFSVSGYTFYTDSSTSFQVGDYCED